MNEPSSDFEAEPLSNRVSGMRDLDPGTMATFRAVERVFLDVTRRAGYLEIRTPTVEPLHLYTSSGSLSPQLLDRTYSFLDWDGWSGERVVLRPDATVAAARWFVEQVAAGALPEGVARLAYVQPVYRFEPEGVDREIWQCGVESFGIEPAELVRLALRLLSALNIEGVEVEIAHAGLVRTALEAAGLDRRAQVEAYDRLLAGETSVADDLLAQYPQGSSALRLLLGVNGDSKAYIANLRATLGQAVPALSEALTELDTVADALDELEVPYRVVPATARNLEYYSGVTFRLLVQDRECVAGGRYDTLCEAIGGDAAPASGFGADLLGLAALVPARVPRRRRGHSQ